jgi:hypothetical protein
MNCGVSNGCDGAGDTNVLAGTPTVVKLNGLVSLRQFPVFTFACGHNGTQWSYGVPACPGRVRLSVESKSTDQMGY